MRNFDKLDLAIYIKWMAACKIASNKFEFMLMIHARFVNDENTSTMRLLVGRYFHYTQLIKFDKSKANLDAINFFTTQLNREFKEYESYYNLYQSQLRN